MHSLPPILQTAAKPDNLDVSLIYPQPNATNSYLKGLVLRYKLHISNLGKNSVRRVFFLNDFYTVNDRPKCIEAELKRDTVQYWMSRVALLSKLVATRPCSGKAFLEKLTYPSKIKADHHNGCTGVCKPSKHRPAGGMSAEKRICASVSHAIHHAETCQDHEQLDCTAWVG